MHSAIWLYYVFIYQRQHGLTNLPKHLFTNHRWLTRIWSHMCTIYHMTDSWGVSWNLYGMSASLFLQKKVYLLSPPTLKCLGVNQEELSIRWGRYVGQFPSKGLYNQYEWDRVHVITNIISFKLIPTGVLTACLRGNQGISDTVEWLEKENIVMCQIRLHQAY